MGLGIAAKYLCNSYQLSRVLHGFLEFMDLATFNRLANYRYNLNKQLSLLSVNRLANLID